MNDEDVALLIVGALIAALLWSWTRRSLAWQRSKREHRTEAERTEMLGAAIRVVSNHWETLAIGGAGRVERLEKQIIELQNAHEPAVGDTGLSMPRNSRTTQQVRAAIEGLDTVGHQVANLAVDGEERASLNLDIEELAARLHRILRRLKPEGGEDSEDDFGTERGLAPATSGTSTAQPADSGQWYDADAASPLPSSNGPPLRQSRRTKRQRRRSKDGGTER